MIIIERKDPHARKKLSGVRNGPMTPRVTPMAC